MTARRPNFDIVARPYRTLEYLTLGSEFERTRKTFLPALMDRSNALVLGDGDGRFLAGLLAANTAIHATVVDSSSAMLNLLCKRCAAFADRLLICQIDALDFQPASQNSYDLVVTHFFLDCFSQSELASLVARIAPLLSPQALWVISDFQIPTGLLRLPAYLLVRSLYLGFRLLTGLRATRLPDHRAELQRAGMKKIAIHSYLAGILIAELWQAGSPDTAQNLQQ